MLLWKAGSTVRENGRAHAETTQASGITGLRPSDRAANPPTSSGERKLTSSFFFSFAFEGQHAREKPTAELGQRSWFHGPTSSSQGRVTQSNGPTLARGSGSSHELATRSAPPGILEQKQNLISAVP